MPHFTLSQLLMGVALIAITLSFTQAEGCGTRYTMIETLSFTSDGSRIAVTTLNARDARTPLKFYKSNVARTISWLNATDGVNRGLIHQDFKPGNCGPAFRLWRVGRTSVLCSPAKDHVVMSAFGGGDVTRIVNASKPTVVNLEHPACNIAYSKSGRFLAASGMCGLTVLDTEDDTVKMRVQVNDLPFLGASLMSFANDESRLIQVGGSRVHLWDISTSTHLSVVVKDVKPLVNAIAVTPDDNVIICSDDWVRRYDFTGQIVATLSEQGAYMCCIARDVERLAICADGELKVYDLNSNGVLRTLAFQGATALAMSSTGEQLAVGDYNGRVALIDIATGVQRWFAAPLDQYRWPWTLPAGFVLVWLYAAWRLFRRQGIAGNAHAESVVED